MNDSLVVLATAAKLAKIGPPLLLAALATLAFVKRGGLRLIRGVQMVDRVVVKWLRRVSTIAGGQWIPKQGWFRQLLQWAWFLGVFGGILALAYFTHGIPRLAAILGGYLLALSVGRTWISEETGLLNGEMGANERRSTLMRPMAMVSFVILMVLIPLSFQETHRELNWYPDAEDTPIAWGMVTADLLLHSVVDFVEYLNPKASMDSLQIHDWREGLLVLVHFMSLAYVVVNGIALVAKSDQTIYAELERLKAEGKIGQIDRLGDRVVGKLVEVLNGREQAPAKGIAAAAEALGKIAMRESVSDRAFKALFRATLHPNPTVRGKATKALGQTGNSRAITKLLKLLLQDKRSSVVEAAGIALRQMPELSQSELKALFGQALELCQKPEPHDERFRRYALAMLFRHHHGWLQPPWTHVEVKKWIESENDEEVRRNLETAMDLCSQDRRELAITAKLRDLASEDSEGRLRAAEGLAPFISDSRVAKALLTALDREANEAVCFQILRSLYLEQEARPALATRVVSCLRKMIEDGRPNVRVAAAEGLRFFRPPMPTTPRILLRRVEEDPDAQVRMVAFMSLLRLKAKKEFLTAKEKLAAYVDQQKEKSGGHKNPGADPVLAEAVYEVLSEMQSGESLDDLFAEWNPDDSLSESPNDTPSELLEEATGAQSVPAAA